jgi:hypothetical protein
MKMTVMVGAAMLAVLLGVYTWRTANTHAAKQATQPQIVAPKSQPFSPVQSAPTSSATAQPVALNTSIKTGEEVEQRLVPISIAGKEYTPVLRKQLPAGAKPGEGLTVISLEIRDSAGVSQFSRAFANEGGDDGFINTVSVSVIPLVGATGNGLLVSYDEDSEPSAPEPESSGWWQVLGVVDGKLKPFSGPLLVLGDLLPADRSDRAQVPGTPITAPGDVLQFKVWSGRFRLIFPLRIDWTLGKLAPAQPCEKTGITAGACDYAVVPEDQRYVAELTFVRLCANPTDEHEKPERVVVKRDSKVELLATRAEVQFNPGKLSGWSGDPKNAMSDAGGISVMSKEPWLKVRIDGKEGWIHGPEDLDALGMPSEQ